MNVFIFTGMTLRKENQISASLKEGGKWEMVFHFFHSFFHILPQSFERRKKYLPMGIKEMILFPIGY
jgi:hypothetical protein